MAETPVNPHPVDSSRVTLDTDGIPDADLDALIAATIPAGDVEADHVYALKLAGKHTRYAAEDITDALESLPADAPLFVCVDVVAALRHIGKASALLASAVQAVAQ